MQVLSQVLDSLRLSGGIFLEGRARGDWRVSSHLLPGDVAELAPTVGPRIAYHYVQAGRIFAQVDGHTAALPAGAGCMLIFPHNDRHQLYTSATNQPVEPQDIVATGAGGVARIEIGVEGPEAEFLSGYLAVGNPGHPLVDSLPPLLVVDVTQAQDEWLDSTIKLMKGAKQAPEAVGQVAEMAFRHAVESHAASLAPGEGGWLSGLNDPAVAKALSFIHARFAEELDLEVLAREAAVSRSVLGERFVELLGEPPMRYCAKWRMRVAANMLRDGKENSANIAYAVGFNSEAAFNRAFKREFGVPPVTWKREVRGAAARSKPTHADDPERRLAAAVRSQRTGSCFSKDGSCIGYSAIGEGYPTLIPAVWYHNVHADWSSPVWKHWLAEGIDGRQLFRSDLRGSGLSERNPPSWTFDALYEDFETVADEVGEQRFDIFAFSHSVNVALAYAARHPDTVRKLLCVGGYARGYAVRGDEAEIKRRETLIEFARNYQTGDGDVFAQMLGSLYWPGARGETVDWFGERLVTIMDLDEAIMEVFRSADVSRELPSIRADTLVMHSRGDRVIGIGCSEEIADAIPGARMLELDSDNHLLIGTEPAWSGARRELRAFLQA